MYGQPDNKVLAGSRNATMQVVTESLSSFGRLGRPVVDPSQAATGMALTAVRLGYRTRIEAPRALAGE